MSYRTIATKQRDELLARIQKRTKKEKDRDKVWDEHFGKQWDSLPVHVACIVLRTYYKRYAAFLVAARASGLNEATIKRLPFVVTTLDPCKVKVFVNIKLPEQYTKTPEALQDISFAVEYKALEKLTKTIKDDAKSEAKAKKWNTLKSCKKTICKRDTITLAKLLTKYKSKDSVSVDSHTVRDMAERITNELKPVELFFAKTKKDYISLFEDNSFGSCMNSNSNAAGDWAACYKATNVHPAVWYYYHTNTQGVGILRNGKIVARTFVYGGNKYGRVYASNTETSKLLKKAMSQYGIEDLVSEDAFSLTKKFKIPGVWYEKIKDYIAPMPYTDNLVNNVYVIFDILSKTFIFAPNKTKDYVETDTRTTRGYIKAKNYVSSLKCSYCGTPTGRISKAITTSNGKAFCNKNCAASLGYHIAKLANSRTIWKHKNELYHDKPAKTYFTTQNACLRNGGRVFIEFLGDPIDLNKLTIANLSRVMYRGNEVKLTSEAFNSLANKSDTLGWRFATRKLKGLSVIEECEIMHDEEVDW